jgi:DNA-binding MarR family transcriptional regulator
LVARGWVNKVTGMKDRRGVLLTLTPEGNSRWSKLKRVISDRNAEIVACLDDGEQTLFSTLLDRLLAHAERRQVNK